MRGPLALESQGLPYLANILNGTDQIKANPCVRICSSILKLFDIFETDLAYPTTMATRGIKYLVMAAAALPSVFSNPTPILQPTPPMGFNNWAALMCGLNESVFVETAQAMVKNGLRDAGYKQINLDDCWSTFDRAPDGKMVWNSEKFPRGLPWLTKYLKSLGFEAGIYTDAWLTSCGGYPGAYGYEELDAETFSSWGFNYLKVDGCNMPDSSEETYKAVYGKWGVELKKQNPPMIFSESAPAYFAEAANLTDWYSVMDWVPKFGNLARHSRDTLVFNSTLYWPDITGWDSIMFNYGQEVRLARYQKPGYFNDPDFLNVDHFDYTIHEKRTHFALWSSLSAPLIISAWVPDLTREEISYLTNKDIIAVDQDPLALQATLVSQDGTWDVLTKNLANGDRLLTLVNRGNFTASYSVPFVRIGLPAFVSTIKVKDLWTGASSVAVGKMNVKNVPSHGSAIFRLSGFGGCDKYIIPTGTVFNTFSLNTLTATAKGVSWAVSTGVDGQVWQTKADGTLSSLFSPSSCLTALGKGKVGLAACSDKKEQKWDYYITGNLQSKSSGECLTEGDNGAISTSKCLYETNSQVLALPSGTEIN